MNFFKRFFDEVSMVPTSGLIAFVLLIYWLGILRHIELPGLYMDAINPDYLAARILNPIQNNPVWILPEIWFTILGSFYYGAQTLYVGIPFYWLFGTNIVAARLVQALFGAAIVVLVFITIWRSTKSRLLAISTALCLATDIAFIASFRTQFYITTSGMVWLLLSVNPLLVSNELSFSRKKILTSGIFFGMATYAYFIYGFFLLAFIYRVAQVVKKGERLRAVLVWCGGVAVGIIPYIFGYLSMGIALGGIGQFLDCVKNGIHTLEPLSSKLTLLEGYRNSFSLVKLAITNGGNELMIFGDYITAGFWSNAKFEIFIAIIFFLIIFWLFTIKKEKNVVTNSYFPLVFLPCSFVFFSGVLGQRLWVHHYALMTPLLYLVAAQLFYFGYKLLFAKCTNSRHEKLWQLFVAGVCTFVLFANFFQQNSFFRQLDKIGGIGKFSNSITILADEAMSNPSSTVYLFPEWGFFMPFAFLTANKIPYRLDVSKTTIDEFRGKYNQISIVFWDLKDAEKYESQLNAIGIANPLIRTYSRKDGIPAFYSMTGALK
jgi:4-amino-4-deoxy-L-arabinose transferase-like glycosyltransferase